MENYDFKMKNLKERISKPDVSITLIITIIYLNLTINLQICSFLL